MEVSNVEVERQVRLMSKHAIDNPKCEFCFVWNKHLSDIVRVV